MSQLTVLALLLCQLSAVASQGYQLKKSYTAENFFDEFTFYTAPDPTGGYVRYVTLEEANDKAMISNDSDIIRLAAYWDGSYPPNSGFTGRPSVRVESKATFTEGLFVLDLLHIPWGCGAWPAFWTGGLGDWPAGGEIDIIEGVNNARSNRAALHAAGDCTVSTSVNQTGKPINGDCNVGHDGNSGCAVDFDFEDGVDYGAGLNQNGGGMYAMEWTNETINIWFFPPDSYPTSLRTDIQTFAPVTPDPATFGVPSASFSGPCSSSFGDKFFNHSIIFDITFCGGWAGSQFWNGNCSPMRVLDPTTPEQACQNAVAYAREEYEETFWAIKNLRVWQKGPTSDSPQSGTMSALEPTVSATPIAVSFETPTIAPEPTDAPTPDVITEVPPVVVVPTETLTPIEVSGSSAIVLEPTDTPALDVVTETLPIIVVSAETPALEVSELPPIVLEPTYTPTPDVVTELPTVMVGPTETPTPIEVVLEPTDIPTPNVVPDTPVVIEGTTDTPTPVGDPGAFTILLEPTDTETLVPGSDAPSDVLEAATTPMSALAPEGSPDLLGSLLNPIVNPIVNPILDPILGQFFGPLGGAARQDVPPVIDPALTSASKDTVAALNVPELNPNAVSVPTEVPTAGPSELPAGNLWGALDDNIKGQLLGLANALAAAGQSTSSISAQIPATTGAAAVPGTPSVSPQDTSNVVGSLLGLLDPDTQGRVVGMLGGLAPGAAIDPSTHSDLATVLTRLAANAKDEKYCSIGTEYDAGSLEWMKQFLTNYVLFNKVYETLPDQTKAEVDNMFDELAYGDGPKPDIDLDHPCDATMYSLEWVQQLALDYVAFIYYADMLSEQAQAELLQFLLGLVEDIGITITKRGIENGVAVRQIIANLIGVKRQFGFHKDAVPQAYQQDDNLGLGAQLHALHVSKTDNLQPTPIGPIIVPTPPTPEESPTDSPAALPPSSGPITNTDIETPANTTFDTLAAFSAANETNPDPTTLSPPWTWVDIFSSLTPDSTAQLRHFLSLFQTFHGRKPQPNAKSGMMPYLEYVNGWEQFWDGLDEELRAKVLDLLMAGVTLPTFVSDEEGSGDGDGSETSLAAQGVQIVEQGDGAEGDGRMPSSEVGKDGMDEAVASWRKLDVAGRKAFVAATKQGLSARRLGKRQLVVPDVEDVDFDLLDSLNDEGVGDVTTQDDSVPESAENIDTAAPSGLVATYMDKIGEGLNQGKAAVGKILSFLNLGTVDDQSLEDMEPSETVGEENTGNPKKRQGETLQTSEDSEPVPEDDATLPNEITATGVDDDDSNQEEGPVSQDFIGAFMNKISEGAEQGKAAVDKILSFLDAGTNGDRSPSETESSGTIEEDGDAEIEKRQEDEPLVNDGESLDTENIESDANYAEQDVNAQAEQDEEQDSSDTEGLDLSEDLPSDEPVSEEGFAEFVKTLDKSAAKVDSLLQNEFADIPLDSDESAISRGSEEDEVILGARQDEPSSDDGVEQDDTLSPQDYADFLGAINEASSNIEELIKEHFDSVNIDDLPSFDDGDLPYTPGAVPDAESDTGSDVLQPGQANVPGLEGLKKAVEADLAQAAQKFGPSSVGTSQSSEPSTVETAQNTDSPAAMNFAQGVIPDVLSTQDTASEHTQAVDNSLDPSTIADIIQGIIPGFTAEDLPLPVDVDPVIVPVPAGVVNDITPLADTDMDFNDDVAWSIDTDTVPDSSILDAIAPVADPDLDFAKDIVPSTTPELTDAGKDMAHTVKDTPLDMLEVNGPGSGELSEGSWTWDKL